MQLSRFLRTVTTTKSDRVSTEDATKKNEHLATNECHADQPHRAPSSSVSLDAQESSLCEAEQAGPPIGEETGTSDCTAQELRRQHAELLRSREEVGVARLEAQEALQQSSALRRWFRESQHELRKFYIRDKGGGKDPDQAEFLSLFNKAIADSNAADAQAITANVLEGKLSSQESRLRDSEVAFSQQLDQWLRMTGAWQSIGLDQNYLENGLPIITQRSPSPTIDPLLDSYYAKAGEVGLLGEEIADLDIGYQQATSLRALKSEQGSPPSESESHYEREYKTSRLDIRKRLDDAIKAAEDAKQECVKANLDPKTLLPDTSLDKFALPEPLLAPPTGEQQEFLGHSGTVTAPGPQCAVAEDKQAIVMEWARRVSENGEETAERSVTKEEVEAINRIDLDKWGFIHVQRPRRHSSVSHLRWKVHESNKQLKMYDETT